MGTRAPAGWKVTAASHRGELGLAHSGECEVVSSLVYKIKEKNVIKVARG